MKRVLLMFGIIGLVWLASSPSAQTVIANNAAEIAGKIVMLADGARLARAGPGSKLSAKNRPPWRPCPRHLFPRRSLRHDGR